LISTGAAAGSFAYFCYALQKHIKTQKNKQINGIKAMKSMQAKN